METRISRYAKLRAEIEKMNAPDESLKSKSSQVVSEILKDGEQSPQRNIPIDETLKSYEVLDEKKEESKEEKTLTVGSKRRIIYIVVASVITLLLLIGLIIFGIYIFNR